MGYDIAAGTQVIINVWAIGRDPSQWSPKTRIILNLGVCCEYHLHVEWFTLPRRVLIFPKGNNVDHLSMYLDVADSTALSYGWSRYAQFSLAVVNEIHSKFTTRKGQVLLVGRDVQNLQLSWLRRLIGSVRNQHCLPQLKKKRTATARATHGNPKIFKMH